MRSGLLSSSNAVFFCVVLALFVQLACSRLRGKDSALGNTNVTTSHPRRVHVNYGDDVNEHISMSRRRRWYLDERTPSSQFSTSMRLRQRHITPSSSRRLRCHVHVGTLPISVGSRLTRRRLNIANGTSHCPPLVDVDGASMWAR